MYQTFDYGGSKHFDFQIHEKAGLGEIGEVTAS
jgi:hypothetical protein